jgi:hypothetical protein
MQLLGKEVSGLLAAESGIEAAEIWLQVGQQPTWERAITDCAWKGVDHCYDSTLIKLLKTLFIYGDETDALP